MTYDQNAESDPRFKQCPNCRRRLLVDAVNCPACPWRAETRRGRARCACGAIASVINASGIDRCSACDAQDRTPAPGDGSGYAEWRRALDALRAAPRRQGADE